MEFHWVEHLMLHCCLFLEWKHYRSCLKCPCVLHLRSKMSRSLQISKSSTSTLSCLLVLVVAMTKGTCYFKSIYSFPYPPPFLLWFEHLKNHLWSLCFAISNTLIAYWMSDVYYSLIQWNICISSEMHWCNKIKKCTSIISRWHFYNKLCKMHVTIHLLQFFINFCY